MKTHTIIGLLCASLAVAPSRADPEPERPRLRIQLQPKTYILWVQPLGPASVAVSYAGGLDVLDGSGAVARRVWPLPAGKHCAGIYPDGRLLLLDFESSPGAFGPAAIRSDGSAIVKAYEGNRGVLKVFDSPESIGRSFAEGLLHPSKGGINGIAATPSGGLLIWGELMLADGTTTPLSRVLRDGSPDPNFRPKLTGYVRNAGAASDGSIFVETVEYDSKNQRELWKRFQLADDGAVKNTFDAHPKVGTWPDDVGATLEDGTFIFSVDRGQRFETIFPNGASTLREGVGYWGSFWHVEQLIPLATGAVVVRSRASCLGPVCFGRDWLRVVPPREGSEGRVVAWVPPAPEFIFDPIVSVDGLLPEAEYVLEGSINLRDWHAAAPGFEPSVERSPDKRSLFLLRGGTMGAGQGYYRVRKVD